MKKRILSFLMTGILVTVSPLQGFAQVVSTDMQMEISQDTGSWEGDSQNTDFQEMDAQEADTAEVSSESVKEEESESDFVIADDGTLTEYTGKDAELIIPDGVTSIKEKVFSENKTITKVTLPDSLKTIGYEAFFNCTSLSEVYFGNKLEQINGYAFYGCKAVKKLTFTSKTVPTITNKAVFFGSNSLVNLSRIYVESGCYGRYMATYGQSMSDNTRIIELEVADFVIENGVLVNYVGDDEIVTVPDKVTEIGTGAFKNNKSVKKVILPEGTTFIGTYAFSGCNALENINMPAELETIGDKAFYNCKVLSETLTLPDGLITIGEYAFYNCAALTGNLYIPDSVGKIGKNAFDGCTGFTGSLHISEKITEIESSVFSGCKFTGTLSLPEKVTAIGSSAFAHNAFSGEVMIPNETKTVGSHAFYYCGNLGSVVFGEQVESIGGFVFQGCTGIKTLIFKGSAPPKIGDFTYFFGSSYGPANLETIYVPAGTYKAYSTAYKAGMSEGVRIIEEGAEDFIIEGTTLIAYTGNEEKVTIPDGITEIGAGAFHNNKTIKKIILPEGLTTIGEKAFYNCKALSGTLVLPDGLIAIGANAFYNCAQLTGDLNIPDSVESMGTGVFYNCSGFTGKLHISEKITKIEDYTFQGCKFTGTLSLPEKVAAIGGSAFAHNAFSGEVMIPNETKTVGSHAFYYCGNLGSVVFGEQVESIGGFVFQGCTGIKTLIFKGSAPPKIGDFTYFFGSSYGPANLETIYVPAESLEIYKDKWSSYAGSKVTFSSDLMTTKVGNLHTDYTFSHSVKLSWNTSLSEKVQGYHIYRDGTLVGNVQDTSFSEDNLELGNYTYEVAGYTTSLEDGKESVQETAKASLKVTLNRPEVKKIYTEYEGNKLCEEGSTLYALVKNTGNLGSKDGTTTWGRFYVLNNGKKIPISNAITKANCKTDDSVLYQTSWDILDLSSGIYTVIFEITDADGEMGTFTVEVEIDRSTPERISKIAALGDVNKIVLSWSLAHELDTNCYYIYRKAEDESQYTCIKKVYGRDTVSYVDTKATRDIKYAYYITAVNSIGRESEPSDTVSAKPSKDEEKPRVVQMSPENGSAISGIKNISVQAEDNIGVVKTEIEVSEDEGESWEKAGDNIAGSGKIALDTTKYKDGKLLVKGFACDAQGNVSTGLSYAYRVDNTGPEQVKGLSGQTTATTATLRWDDVSDNDFSYFCLERKLEDGTFKKVQDIYNTLGINLTDLVANTTYIYRVVAYDQCGNRGTESEELEIKTTEDKEPPQILSMNPAANYYNKSIPLKVAIKDDTGIASVRIQISRNKINWTDVQKISFDGKGKKETAQYTLRLDDYAEGSIYVRVVATDTLGNEMEKDIPFVEYIIDRTAPSIPTGLKTDISKGRMELKWEQNKEEDIDSYELYRSVDGENYEKIAENIQYLNYWEENIERGQEFWYQLAAKDKAGNISEKTEAVSAIVPEDNQAPVMESSLIKDGDIIGGENKTFRIWVSDNDKLDTVNVSYRVAKSSEKSLLFQETDINCREKVLEKTLPVAQWTNGETITFSVTITDKAGHITLCSDIGCTVDKIAPTLSSFKASGKEDSVLLNWTGNQEKDLKEYQIYRKIMGGKYTFLNTVKAGETEEYTYEDEDAKQGEIYVYKIKACDYVGNFSEKESENVWRKNKISVDAVLSCESWMEQSVEYAFRADESKADTGIASYTFDFGDGENITSDKSLTKHKYKETGNYKVVLTVEDKEGNRSVAEKLVQVEEAKLIGTVKVKVTDSSGNALSNAPVYFDMDRTMENKNYTDVNGCVEFNGVSQKYAVGAYMDGYLPVKKNILIQAGEKTELKITLTKQSIVTGNFEINRMTLDEIVAAKIDTNNPDNQYVSKFTVRMMYQNQPVEMTGYINSNGQMIKSEETQKRVVQDVNGTSCTRKLECFIPRGKDKSKVIAVMDTPVTASCLKEFFDVRLYVFNQADGEFELTDNSVALNLPEGLTEIHSENTAFSSLKGQEEKQINWIIRGDKEGSYPISVDYRGTLMPFEEPVKATFKSAEKLQVYGTGKLSVNFEVSKTIRNNVLYFNLSITNNNPVDVYITSFDVIDNMLKSNQNTNTLPEGFPLDTRDSCRGIKILRTSLSAGENNIKYLKPEYELNILGPGQTFKKYYACYDVINYDGTAFFGWIRSVFNEKMDIPVTLTSTEMNLYSKSSAKEKKDSILTDPEKRKIYEFIKDEGNENFYYYIQAFADDEDNFKKFGEATYRLTDCILNWDSSLITNKDMKDITRQYVVNLLTDECMQSNVDQKVEDKYIDIASGVLSEMGKMAAGSSETELEEISSFVSNADTINTLAEAIKGDGERGFKEKLLTLAGSTVATEAVANAIYTYCDDNNHFLAPVFQEAVKEECGSCQKIIGQVATGATAWNNSAEFINQMITISANKEESIDCIDKLMSSGGINKAAYEELKDIRDKINNGYETQADKFMSEYAKLAVKAQGKVLLDKGLNLIDEMFYGEHYVTPIYTVLKVGFNVADDVFEWSDSVNALQKLRVAASLSYSIKYRLKEEESSQENPSEFLSTLKYLIKMRLEGEKAYIESVKDSGEEKKVLEALNKELGTNFSLIDEYYNYIQTQLITYRDELFNEITENLDIAAAPDISIDYENELTNKALESNLEYSYDGVHWMDGTGVKLSVVPGEASRHLWVRQKADSSGVAGNIKKILIPTRPTIAGEIKAVYQNGKITFTGLESGTYTIAGIQKKMSVVSGTGVVESDSFASSVQIQKDATTCDFASRTRIVTVERGTDSSESQPTQPGKTDTQPLEEATQQPGATSSSKEAARSKEEVQLRKVKILSLKKKKSVLTIKWKRVTNVSGYEVLCATKKNFKAGLKKQTISAAEKNSAKVKKIKAKKTYYVKVRAFKKLSNGNVIYGKWSAVKSKK